MIPNGSPRESPGTRSFADFIHVGNEEPRLVFSPPQLIYLRKVPPPFVLEEVQGPGTVTMTTTRPGTDEAHELTSPFDRLLPYNCRFYADHPALERFRPHTGLRLVHGRSCRMHPRHPTVPKPTALSSPAFLAPRIPLQHVGSSSVPHVVSTIAADLIVNLTAFTHVQYMTPPVQALAVYLYLTAETTKSLPIRAFTIPERHAQPQLV